MFGIYVVTPTDANILRIAEDFGYTAQPLQKVKTLQEIKDFRKQQSGLFKSSENKNYNPYLYRGCFVITTSPYKNQNLLQETGLLNVCTQPTSIDLEFLVRESHFIDLLQPEAFLHYFVQQKNVSEYVV